MKLKIKDIISIQKSLVALSSIKLPAKTSYRLGKSINLMSDEINSVEKLRVDLLKELGSISETSENLYTFSTPELELDFQNQVFQLYEEESDIEFPVIKVEDLGNDSIESEYLRPLMYFGILVD